MKSPNRAFIFDRAVTTGNSSASYTPEPEPKDPLQGFHFPDMKSKQNYINNPDTQSSGKSIYQYLTPQEYGALSLAEAKGDVSAKNELKQRYELGQRSIMDSESAQMLKGLNPDNDLPRSRTRPLTTAEQYKFEAEAKQAEESKARGMQIAANQEAYWKSGDTEAQREPDTTAQRLANGTPNEQAQYDKLKRAGQLPGQDGRPISGRGANIISPNALNIQLITSEIGVNGSKSGYYVINPDGSQRPVTQADWQTEDGKALWNNIMSGGKGGGGAPKSKKSQNKNSFAGIPNLSQGKTTASKGGAGGKGAGAPTPFTPTLQNTNPSNGFSPNGSSQGSPQAGNGGGWNNGGGMGGGQGGGQGGSGGGQMPGALIGYLKKKKEDNV